MPLLRAPHPTLELSAWPTGRRAALYLLSQRRHDVVLFPDAYAWVMHGVIINHHEPQETADTANATWEAGIQLVFR